MTDQRPPQQPSNEPSTLSSPGAPPVTLNGETVDISYVSDPAIGHGAFRLSNAGDAAISAAVTAAWLELGSQRRPLDHFTIYDLSQERMIDPKHLQVGAKATLGFLLGFPSLAYEPAFGESAAVGATLSAGGVEVTARSPLRFVRRIPRRP